MRLLYWNSIEYHDSDDVLFVIATRMYSIQRDAASKATKSQDFARAIREQIDSIRSYKYRINLYSRRNTLLSTFTVCLKEYVPLLACTCVPLAACKPQSSRTPLDADSIVRNYIV